MLKAFVIKWLNNFSTTMSDFASSQEEYDSDDLSEPTEFDHAPYDVFGEEINLGKVIVVKAGEALPKVTKYISKQGCDVAVRFK